MGTLNTIVAELESVVTDLNRFSVVKRYATNAFDGYPAVTIVNAEVISDYDTQAQNLRTYTIMVYIYESMEQADDEAKWDEIRDHQDAVLDAVDRSLDLAATADFIRPSASQPFEATSADGGKLLVAPIRIQAVKSIGILPGSY